MVRRPPRRAPRAGSAPPALAAGIVHVWLSPPPRTGGARSSRRAARRFLEAVLARYGIDRVRLTRGPQGRPRLVAGAALDFNLSHSGGRVAVAVTRAGRTGIDIERLRPVPACGAVIREIFGIEAERALLPADEPARSASFLRLWARLEAAVKAAGADLSQSARAFRLAATTGAVRIAASADGAPARYAVQDLDLGAGFVGAVALDRAIRRVITFALSPP
jgi:4'-phosphopantetheinyl transferase